MRRRRSHRPWLLGDAPLIHPLPSSTTGSRHPTGLRRDPRNLLDATRGRRTRRGSRCPWSPLRRRRPVDLPLEAEPSQAHGSGRGCHTAPHRPASCRWPGPRSEDRRRAAARSGCLSEPDDVLIRRHQIAARRAPLALRRRCGRCDRLAVDTAHRQPPAPGESLPIARATLAGEAGQDAPPYGGVPRLFAVDHRVSMRTADAADKSE